MIIAPLQEVMSPPSVGMILGGSGARDILEGINKTFGTGVIFGQAGDPFASHYNSFMSNVVNVVAQTGRLIETAKNVLLHNEPIRAIATDDDLRSLPTCMRIPILTMPECRELLKKGQIDGWGLEDTQLPEEDVVGRLAEQNGYAVLNGPDAVDEITWCWKSTDPVYTPEELYDLELSRRYVRHYLKRELGPDGERRDFTDPNGIGKISR
jgi:hypothetical protein